MWFFLSVSLLIFSLAILGIFITRKNIIIILISLELMLLAVNFNFIIFSIISNDACGQVFTLFILTLAGAESAVGLAVLIIFYRIRGVITLNFINSLKG
jgi:NADH-quinone oxidoreductase subunit K